MNWFRLSEISAIFGYGQRGIVQLPRYSESIGLDIEEGANVVRTRAGQSDR